MRICSSQVMFSESMAPGTGPMVAPVGRMRLSNEYVAVAPAQISPRRSTSRPSSPSPDPDDESSQVRSSVNHTLGRPHRQVGISNHQPP